MTRRAKIVCTIGPATADPELIRALVDAGMDVARLNFSHGTHADHERAYRLVREAARDVESPVAVLADLPGPKIRLGAFADGPVRWDTGNAVVLTTDDVPGSAERVSIGYSRLPREVTAGDRILVDDGRVALQVERVEGTDIHTRVSSGGEVSDHKGVSLPGVALGAPALSAQDEVHLRFALQLGVDVVALSFVRSPDDVGPVRDIMGAEGVWRPVLAKLEKPEAAEALDAVVDAFDGLMVARGDLGVELSLEQVPLVQKRAVQRCRDSAKPVIVATQMLDSMMERPQPTRAEASDVANAVLDGADALMLSGETSVGRYPVRAARTMAAIVAGTEAGEARLPPELRRPGLQHPPHTTGGAITLAATQVVRSVDARALVAFTQTGDTVRRLARLHCELPLLAFTTHEPVRRQLSLSWGVRAFLVPAVHHTDEMFAQVDQALRRLGTAEPGDQVVIVAGSPPGTPGSTNLLRVHTVGSPEGA